jgi:HD-like signal output (HDOD) protein
VFGELFQRQNNQILSMDEVLDMVRDYHCVFGEALSKKWDLGDEFCFVTRHHHDLQAYRDQDESKTEFIRLMHVVNLADQLVDYAGASYYAKVLPAPGLQESYTALNVNAEAKEELRNRAESMYVELFG